MHSVHRICTSYSNNLWMTFNFLPRILSLLHHMEMAVCGFASLPANLDWESKSHSLGQALPRVGIIIWLELAG